MNRRNFLKTAAIAGASVSIGTSSTLLSSCNGNGTTNQKQPIERLKKWRIPNLVDKAVDGKPIKVGLIGCGGQGTGDLLSLMKAADGIEIVSLGDIFQDKIDNTRERIKNETGQQVAADKCFTGFDAYLKVIDSGIDLVLMAVSPIFYSTLFDAAIRAGKHVFMEKPAAIDVAGAMKVLATGKMAQNQGLSVVIGTQYRRQRSYVEAFKQIADGAMGEITGGNIYYNQGMLWYRNREKGWSDMEWMLRDWVNWCWLSGDHIIEQHIHNIDVFSWFSGLTPVSATGFGARQRRLTGDQYDMFSVDFVFENDVHVHSMCRQIDGCTNNVSNIIRGTHGVWTNIPARKSEIIDLKGNVIWSWDFEKEKQEFKQTSPYVLQLVDLINSIRNNDPISEVDDAITSSLIAIMGRESAYTGQTISLEQLKGMNMNFLPDNVALGAVDMSKFKVPIPGSSSR